MESKTLLAKQSAEGEVKILGSKSLTNRALLLSALAVDKTYLTNLLDADDTKRMKEALHKLGVFMVQNPSRENAVVYGKDGLFNLDGEFDLDLGNAGTAFRPLIAALAFNQGNASFTIHGEERMHQRPVAPLVDALRQLGAQITYLGEEGYPPLRIDTTLVETSNSSVQAKKANSEAEKSSSLFDEYFDKEEALAKVQAAFFPGAAFDCAEEVDKKNKASLEAKEITLDGSLSSQFLTSILLVAPLLPYQLTIDIAGTLVSTPYIDMTLNCLKRFGVEVEVVGNYQAFITKPSFYQCPEEFLVEGDASSASYFLLAGALAGKVKVKGINLDSIQGDIAFAKVLEDMGAIIEGGSDYVEAKVNQELLAKTGYPLKAINLDANHIPDAAMGIAIAALFTPPGEKTTISNVYNWRLKETDRLNAMATELRKLGVEVEEGEDYLTITSPEQMKSNVDIDTYKDHRMAMCFSLLAFSQRLDNIIINDPGCVNKTFPNYFELLEKILVD